MSVFSPLFALLLADSSSQALQPIIATALPVMDKAETNALRLANLNVLVNAILYNPAAALHILDQAGPGVARKFFDKWFAAINVEARLPRVHDKKLSIVALSALMEMDPANIPESVKEGWPGIVSGALKLFQEYPKAVAGQFDVLTMGIKHIADQPLQPARSSRKHSRPTLTPMMTRTIRSSST